MDQALRAGAAIYNAGRFHAAHDAWEDRWLAVKGDPDRADDELLLHGLIQFTAAVHHGHGGNWAGLQGLAESGRGYLAELPADYRGVNVDAVREYLRELAVDPEHLERAPPPALTVDGEAVGFADLAPEAVELAALALAAETEGLDEAVIERAVTFAREDRGGHADHERGEGGFGTGAFDALLHDLLTDDTHRPTIQRRLEQHVERREAALSDVDGLFEE